MELSPTVVAAMISGGISACGLVVTVILTSRQRRQDNESLRVEREKLEWLQKSFFHERTTERDRQWNKESLSARMDGFSEIAAMLARMNDTVRQTISRNERTRTELVDSCTPRRWTAIQQAHREDHRQIFEELPVAILEVSQRRRLHIDDALHRYIRDYWGTTVSRLAADWTAAIENITNANPPEGFDDLAVAVREIGAQVIALNRDFREQLVP